MRGIYCNFFEKQKHSRFNPARAGNIDTHPKFQLHVQVQPRPCGEYDYDVIRYQDSEGSTPPVRGIFLNFDNSSVEIRFNPARAGNIIAL